MTLSANDFTKEELNLIEKATLYFRTHGCSFNGEEYQTSFGVLGKVWSGLHKEKPEQPR